MQQDFLFPDGNNKVVLRFEHMLRSRSIGYFDVEEFELLAEYYSSVLELKKALIVVDEGLNQHPNSNALLIQKSRIFYKLGRYKTALALLKSIAGYNFDIESLMLEGEIHLRLKQPKLADDCFERLLSIATDEKDQNCLDIAYIYMGVGEKQMAFRYLKLGLKDNPKSKDILFELALANEDQGETKVAIKYYNRLLDLDPYNEDAWFSLAMAYINTEDFMAAIDALDFVLAIDEAFVSAHMHKGNALMRLEQFNEAIEAFECYGTYDDNLAEAKVYQAECYEEMADFDVAISLYQDAIARDEEFLEAYTGMGFCQQKIKNYDESIAYFLKALELNKDDDEVWAAIGESYMAVMDYSNAQQAFKTSLEINSEQIDLWVYSAGICINKNEISDALEFVKNGLMREPEAPELLILFAYCLILSKQGEQAKALLDMDISDVILDDLQTKFPKFNPSLVRNIKKN